MLFSYYFDTDKTHLLNCTFKVLQFAEKAQGVIEIMFSAEVSEWQNGVRKRQEVKVATFQFPPTEEGKTKHDIDFTRVRYGDQKKWIFTVINNKDNAQKLEVGLISTSANKNPLGLDVYHDDDEFNAELKGNNLSILESTYQPPVLNQTVVSANFDQAGSPERFSSFTANYDTVYKNQTVKDFRQDFLDEITANTPFKIQLDIAPTNVNPAEGTKVFDLNIPNLGKVSVHKTMMEFLMHDGRADDIQRALFDAPIQPSDFFDNGMKANARMTIEGDGVGGIIIKYNNKIITTVYDHTKSFSYIDFRGAYAGAIV